MTVWFKKECNLFVISEIGIIPAEFELRFFPLKVWNPGCPRIEWVEELGHDAKFN
jgi:hypothetical protein